MASNMTTANIAELQKRCIAGYCVYSPSRGKYYDFGPNKRHYSITSSSLSSCDGCYYSRVDAYQRLGIAKADGWTDAKVAIIYYAPPYQDGDRSIYLPAKIDALSLTINKQEFAEWLINNNYCSLVQFVGDL